MQTTAVRLPVRLPVCLPVRLLPLFFSLANANAHSCLRLLRQKGPPSDGTGLTAAPPADPEREQSLLLCRSISQSEAFHDIA
ncbi:hypothetical protein ACSS6W_003170 [Trichoderma asperelloides]